MAVETRSTRIIPDNAILISLLMMFLLYYGIRKYSVKIVQTSQRPI
jgi:hypothetical protein